MRNLRRDVVHMRTWNGNTGSDSLAEFFFLIFLITNHEPRYLTLEPICAIWINRSAGNSSIKYFFHAVIEVIEVINTLWEVKVIHLKCLNSTFWSIKAVPTLVSQSESYFSSRNIEIKIRNSFLSEMTTFFPFLINKPRATVWRLISLFAFSLSLSLSISIHYLSQRLPLNNGHFLWGETFHLEEVNGFQTMNVKRVRKNGICILSFLRRHSENKCIVWIGSHIKYAIDFRCATRTLTHTICVREILLLQLQQTNNRAIVAKRSRAPGRYT